MSAIYNKYKLFYKVNVMDFIFLQHYTHISHQWKQPPEED
ncbi:hypothetical protein IWX76_001034 [Pedobacter sp. CAN_A7]